MLENRFHHEVSDELMLSHSNGTREERLLAFARNDPAFVAQILPILLP
jgi:hypothetical protein